MLGPTNGLNPDEVSFDDFNFEAGVSDNSFVIDDDATKTKAKSAEEGTDTGTEDTPAGEETPSDAESGEGTESQTGEESSEGGEDSESGDGTEASEEEQTIVGELAKLLNVELPADSEYGDDLEGIAKMYSDLLPSKVEEAVSERYSTHPEAMEFLKFLEQGGDASQYFDTMHPDQSFAEITITDDNVTTQEDLVRNDYKLRGLDDTAINALIDSAKSGGNLKQLAEAAKQSLTSAQEAQKAQMSQQIKDAEQAAADAQAKTKADVKSILDKGTIAGVQIPIPNREELQEYLFEPVDSTGASQYAKDSNELSLENQVFLAYLVKNEMKLESLVKSMVKTSKAQDLKDILLKKKAKSSSDAAAKGVQSSGVNPDELVYR